MKEMVMKMNPVRLTDEEKKRVEQFREIMGDSVEESMLDTLCQYGFFRQAASTKFHGAYAGGLFDHSLAVTKNLLSLTEKLDLKWLRPESPKIIGMFHDLCKIDQYIECGDGTFRFVKTQLAGHGDKSVLLLATMMQMTEEESVCIEQHMGAFVDKTMWNAYTDAVKRFPNVLFTHTADMMASCIDKV